MKERIGKIVIALAETYLPTWLYCTIAGILLVWFLYDVSKPNKPVKHYWMYHSIVKDEQRIEIGVLENESDKFSFTNKEFDIKNHLYFQLLKLIRKHLIKYFKQLIKIKKIEMNKGDYVSLEYLKH